MKNSADRCHDSEELCSLERKCLALAASGRHLDDIASDVGITVKEANILFYCAQSKLGASNRMQAIARYLADEMTGNMTT